MRIFLVLLTIFGLLLAGSGLAQNKGDQVWTGNGGYRFVGGTGYVSDGTGPSYLEAYADGKGTLVFHRFIAGAVTPWATAEGDTFRNLRAGVKRFDFRGAQIDSVTYRLETATEVLPTW